MYFNLITNLSSDELHFKCLVATCGYHIGQYRSVPVVTEGGKEEVGETGKRYCIWGSLGEPGASRKWPETGEWGGELESRKA